MGYEAFPEISTFSAGSVLAPNFGFDDTLLLGLLSSLACLGIDGLTSFTKKAKMYLCISKDEENLSALMCSHVTG